MLTQEELKKYLNYDSETGLFTWLIANSIRVKINSEAGCRQNTGHVLIGINKQKFLAHRLAYLYMTGEFPENYIDHINGITDDNRWVNLRPATHKENIRNTGMYAHNTSGSRGVYFRKDTKRWQAQVKLLGKHISLGCFGTLELASIARDTAVRKIYGEFFHETNKDTLV